MSSFPPTINQGDYNISEGSDKPENRLMSNLIGKLAEALAAAQLEYQPVLKDTTNPYYNSKYADLSSVISATQPALAKHGLVVLQAPIVHDGKAGVITTLAHSSGQWVSNELLLPGSMKGKDGSMRFDAQSVGSAITYARRYSYQSIVGVAAEIDDDGNSASGMGTKQAANEVAQRKIADKRTQQESISLSLWKEGHYAVSGHGLSIIAANVEGGAQAFAFWQANDKVWIMPTENFALLKDICTKHKVELIFESILPSSAARQPTPVVVPSKNPPVQEQGASTVAGDAPLISTITEKKGKNGMYLTVIWDGKPYSCFDKELFQKLILARGKHVELMLSPKNSKGYQNITGIKSIDGVRFDQTATDLEFAPPDDDIPF